MENGARVYILYKNNIKKYRKNQNLTLEDLATRTGLTPGYLCHLECGTRSNPSFKAMNKIAVALNTNIFDIFINE